MATDRPARVAMLAHSAYTSDPRIRREAEALVGQGCEVHVIALSEKRNGVREARNGNLNGVHIHRLPVSQRRGGFLRYVYEYSMVGFLGALKLAWLHSRRALNVVHVHNMPDILIMAGLLPRLLGSKLVLDVHDPAPELYMSWGHGPRDMVVRLLALQEKFSCWLADTVISVNDTMRDNLRSKGVPDDKIFIVHNFPDQQYFPLADMPASWPKKADSLVLLYCGTITEHYDLGLAVRAMAKLKGQVPLTLRIMGRGNRLAEVLELATALGVRDSIELVPPVPVDKVAAEMSKADVGISCHREGIFGDLYFSTKIVEYLTQGLCVLSPRTITVKRYLPEDTLFYFTPGDADALAEAISFAWRNPTEVLKRLARAREILPQLSWNAERSKFIDFYSRLMNDGMPSV
jgi:glycosyltransferase involved in cell wall biosynthesis